MHKQLNDILLSNNMKLWSVERDWGWFTINQTNLCHCVNKCWSGKREFFFQTPLMINDIDRNLYRHDVAHHDTDSALEQ